MSELHDIEQIGRILHPGTYAGLDHYEDKAAFRKMYSHMFAEIEAQARTLLPLIASAREEGRIAGAQGIDNQEALEAVQAVFDRGFLAGEKSMQERLVAIAATKYVGSGWHPAAINAGIGITAALREEKT